jgi:6,7-dimethyl-8-ribityllumazine synthase
MSSQHKNLSDFSGSEIPSATPYSFGIVVAEWNREITDALYKGAYQSLLWKQIFIVIPFPAVLN